MTAHAEIVFFHPNYAIFQLGVSLNRYEEYTEDSEKFRIRKELDIGFFFFSIRINFCFEKELVDMEDDDD